MEISGPEADAIAAELAAWWKVEMGGDLRPEAPPAMFEENTRSGDPVAVASLVVSVVALAVSLPGAALSAADLAKRVELGKKLERFAEWVRDKRRKHPKVRIAVVPEQGSSVDPASAEPARVLEALGLASQKPGRGQPERSGGQGPA